MNEELILIVCLLTGIAAMIFGVFSYQRRKESGLANQIRIEIPIESLPRTVLVVLGSMLVVPVLVGVVGAATDPWMRQYALAAVLVSAAGGGASIVVALFLTRAWRRVGALVWTEERLELDFGRRELAVDLTRGFELFEATTLGPGSIRAQVVRLDQDERAWGFSYALPMRRAPYGNKDVRVLLPPLLGAEARVVHDRLRAASA